MVTHCQLLHTKERRVISKRDFPSKCGIIPYNQNKVPISSLSDSESFSNNTITEASSVDDNTSSPIPVLYKVRGERIITRIN